MPNTRKKILIVDDEKAIVHALELKLRNSGFETKSASDGAQALELLSAEKFDLMLMDLIMPKMDGFTLLAELQKQQNPLPIIVLSNLNQPEDLDRARKLGAKEFFVKSDTSLSGVVENVQRVIGA